MNNANALFRLFGMVVLLSWAVASTAQESAGKVEELRGTAEAVSPDNSVKRLAVGATLREGDRIRVARDSRVRMRFGDGTLMELGANGNMILDRYAFSPEPEKNEFATRVLLGTFRMVTGLIALRNPRTVSVRIPVATIGIRGTHFVGEVQETSAKVILLDPEEKDQATAIEVSNGYGQVVIDKPGFGTEIPDQFSPPSPVRQMQLRQIQNILRSIRSSQPINMPRGPR